MIDIHTHILPGIDDGSESLEESLEMAEIAVSNGTRALALTCHSNQLGRYENFESPELRNLFREFNQALKQEKIPLMIVRGMEIFASPDMIDKIRQKKLISLNGSGNYLVEFSFQESPVVMGSVLSDMIKAGYRPILAHPERYYCIQDDPNWLMEWRRMGIYAQLNKGSIFGRFGQREARTAEILLEHRMINCIASDAHGTRARTPELREIGDYLSRRYSDEDRKLLLEVIPSRMLMGKELPELAPPIPVERRKWF